MTEESVDIAQKTLTTEQKQLLYLRRNWELIEVTKKIRTQIPIVSSSMLLAITGYVLSKDEFLVGPVRRIATLLVILILTFVSLGIMRAVFHQYSYRFKIIFHLYKELGILSEQYRPQGIQAQDEGLQIHRWLYAMVFCIGTVCGLAVLLSP